MEIKGLLGKYYTVKEVADIFGVSYQTVYNWCQSGMLHSFKLGGNVRIYEVHLQVFIKNGDRFASPSTERL